MICLFYLMAALSGFCVVCAAGNRNILAMSGWASAFILTLTLIQQVNT